MACRTAATGSVAAGSSASCDGQPTDAGGGHTYIQHLRTARLPGAVSTAVNTKCPAGVTDWDDWDDWGECLRSIRQAAPPATDPVVHLVGGVPRQKLSRAAGGAVVRTVGVIPCWISALGVSRPATARNGAKRRRSAAPVPPDRPQRCRQRTWRVWLRSCRFYALACVVCNVASFSSFLSLALRFAAPA